MIPLFYITDFSGLGFYIFACLPMMCLSSLVFVYFFSLFWRDEDSGTKILLSSILISSLVILFLYSNVLMPLSAQSEFFKEIFLNFLEKRFLFTLFDITPLTSLGLTLYRVCYSYQLHLKGDREMISKFYKPIWYVISGAMMQMINFIAYFILLVLHETGALSRCFMKMHSSESEFVFSEESVAEDFYAYNNLRNPLIYFQNANNSLNSSNNNNQNVNNNIDTNNNINSINDSRSQTQSSIDIDTNPQNNINNSNNINNNNVIIQNPIPIPDNQINPMINNANLDNVNPFVQAEINKIRTNPNLSTKIEGLHKTFFNCCKKNVRVVNNLYLGLEPNEKFGLLGFNGSGKTTTFRAITNELMYEKGSVTLFGYDGKTQFDKLRPMIGYCPQENPLFDYMKVKEIIKFYLNLKKSNETIESVCRTFNLTKYLDTYCVNLSGGNKRKLTFAIALMNKPSLLLLDEPSTGVDPESRRIMWKNINELSNTGHQYNMILTTHSIEEAEILCDRVSWLKKGNFVCIGNPEQLKLKYSNGYKLHIKFLDTVVNKEDVAKLTRQMVQDEYNAIISLVQDFNKYSNYIVGNPIITLYIRVLVRIARELKPNTYKLRLLQIEKDFSFMLEVGVLREKQKELFGQIFNMKKRNPEISEISINLESLGNILTYFK
jgi:ABC-type multidrug transport system ATPase subunit